MKKLNKNDLTSLILLFGMSFFLFADQNLMGPNLTQIADDFGFNSIERDVKLGGEISLVFWLIGGFVTLFFGYFTDTVPGIILRVDLDSSGWPKSKPEAFIDCRRDGLNPDGSVVDQDGCIWNAQWGASRVARYSPNGEFLNSLEFDVPQISCPEFGGADLSTLFVTSARVDLSESQIKEAPMSGALFSMKTNYKGQKAHQILLS